MKRYRVFATVMACLSTAFAFAGCGNTSDAGSGTENPNPPIIEPEDPPAEEKKPIDRTEIYINDADDKPVPEPRPFDDTVKYDYSGVVYENVSGRFTESDGTYTAVIPNFDLALCCDTPFPYGTVSCTVRTNNLVDAGFLFCVTDPPVGAFNDANMMYYYYFIGMGGSAYLGKWNGKKNEWSALRVKQLGAVDPNRDYELKVVLKSNYMVCFVDGEVMFGYKDEDFSEGTGFGLRVTAHPDVNPASSATGVTISDVRVTSEYVY